MSVELLPNRIKKAFHVDYERRMRYEGAHVDVKPPNSLIIGTEMFYELRQQTPTPDWWPDSGSYMGLKVYITNSDREIVHVCYIPPKE